MSLYSLENYETQFNAAKKTYEEIHRAENEASVLMKWFIENNISDNIFYNTAPGENVLTLENLVKLYHTLHWSLYDDGGVIFMKTERSPVIFFDHKGEYSEKLPETISHHFLPNSPIKVEGEMYTIFEFIEEWESKNQELLKHRPNYKSINSDSTIYL